MELLQETNPWPPEHRAGAVSTALLEFSVVAQWKERPPEVMGSISVGDSGVSFVPRSFHVDQFSFHIIFIHLIIWSLYYPLNLFL